MDWVVEVVSSICARSKSRHGLVEETPVGRGVGGIGGEVDGASVDHRVGRDISNRGQKVVHHARVVGVVESRSNKPRLQGVAEEKRPGQSDVVQEEQCCSVGEDRVDVDIFDVRQVGNTVFGQVQVTQLCNWAEFTEKCTKSYSNTFDRS